MAQGFLLRHGQGHRVTTPAAMSAAEPATRGGSRDAATRSPSVSILTFVRNAADTLPEAIESVLRQTAASHVDYIVVDGGSDDGTVEILRRYDADINVWISEKDGGIVDAQNKAISLSRSDFIFCLSADDWVGPDFVKIAIDAIAASDAELVYGDLEVHSRSGRSLHKLAATPKFFGSAGARYQMPCVNFPTMVIRRSLFEEIGLFDERFRVAPDFEWLLRLVTKRSGVKSVYVPALVTHFRMGGNSDVRYYLGLKDAYRAAVMHGGSKALAGFYYLKRILMHWCKKLAQHLMPASLFVKLLRSARNVA